MNLKIYKNLFIYYYIECINCLKCSLSTIRIAFHLHKNRNYEKTVHFVLHIFKKCSELHTNHRSFLSSKFFLNFQKRK